MVTPDTDDCRPRCQSIARTDRDIAHIHWPDSCDAGCCLGRVWRNHAPSSSVSSGIGHWADAAEDDDQAPPPEWLRTRATAWDLIRAAEVHDYDAVCGENVVDFATRWNLFDAWLNVWDALGYNAQIASVNAAHLSGPGQRGRVAAPESHPVRLHQKGLPLPDLRVRPSCRCPEYGPVQRVIQVWGKKFDKPGVRKIGTYGDRTVAAADEGVQQQCAVEGGQDVDVVAVVLSRHAHSAAGQGGAGCGLGPLAAHITEEVRPAVTTQRDDVVEVAVHHLRRQAWARTGRRPSAQVCRDLANAQGNGGRQVLT